MIADAGMGAMPALYGSALRDVIYKAALAELYAVASEAKTKEATDGRQA
jgi:hypothetical protein